MVVEDDYIIALDIKKSVINFGYTVPIVVHSGEEAIEATGKFKPDLILMDIMLNGDLSGLEAGQLIWENFRVPIIYITSYFDDSTLKNEIQPSFNYDYLIKPFNIIDLKLKIENFLYS
jgi:DNA-binding response OmpR family regulator